MREGIFTVYDRVAAEGGPPFTAKNEGVALRQYDKLLEQYPNMNPGDFRLYRIANWDSEDMKVYSLDSPKEVFGRPSDESEGV